MARANCSSWWEEMWMKKKLQSPWFETANLSPIDVTQEKKISDGVMPKYVSRWKYSRNCSSLSYLTVVFLSFIRNKYKRCSKKVPSHKPFLGGIVYVFKKKPVKTFSVFHTKNIFNWMWIDIHYYFLTGLAEKRR